MKSFSKLAIAIAAIALTAASCQKKSDPPIGGLGGTATLTILPQHHGLSWPIDSLTVYIKYNATDAPASGLYDDSAKCICADSIATCSFVTLKNGNYYLYGRGYDTNVHYRIGGGSPVSIANQNTTISTNLAVTEY